MHFLLYISMNGESVSRNFLFNMVSKQKVLSSTSIIYINICIYRYILSSSCVIYRFLSILQIIVWGYGNWEKKNITLLQISSGWMPSETSETYVQFYGDELHFLVVHETQLAVYEATKLERVKQVSLLVSSTYIMFSSTPESAILYMKS